MSTLKTAVSASLYRRLLRYALPYKRFLAISILGFALFAGMEAMLAMTLEFFIDRLEGKQTNSLGFLPVHISGSLLFIPLAVVVLSVARGVGAFLGNFYMSRLGLNVVTELRKQVFSHMLYLPQSYYDAHNSGELVALIVYNIEQVTGSVTNAVKILLRDGFSLIAFLSLLLYYNWQLTLIFFFVMPILAGLIYFASRYFRKVSRKIQGTVGKVTHIATETFQGISLVKSYLGEAFEQQRFIDATEDNLKYSTKYERVNAFQTPVLHCVIACALAIIFFLVLVFWQGSAASAVVYVSVAGLIAKPFRQLSTVNAIIQRGLAAAETIFTTLDTPQQIDTGHKSLGQVQGKIVFEQVSFSYNEHSENPAIENLSFTIEPGQTVALVGHSGSGKSTIANLLLRFYEPSSGRICIDGVDIRELNLTDLRSNISLVNQQSTLFNESVQNNIAYGQEAANISTEAILQAAKQASAADFIAELDQGLQTYVGEDGARLSGGQRQRIAIARALYKDAPILVLDEATSALDNKAEEAIRQSLDKLRENRSALVIAHRLSTIESADTIIVLDKGKIIEQGTHTELQKRNGHYATLHKASDT